MVGAFRRGVFTIAYLAGRGFERAATLLFHAASGATRLDDLHRSIQYQWDVAGQRGWDPSTYSGLMHWEKDFYPRFLKPGDRVLAAGCGTGREMIALLEQGFDVEGVDVAPGCVQLAKRALAQRGLAAEVHACAVDDLPPLKPFDVVILLTQLYSLMPQTTARLRTLRRVAKLLNPGGRVLLSYIERAGRPPHPGLVRISRLVGALTGADWRPEYGDVLITSRSGRVFDYFEHRFLPEEIEAEARAAGLRVLAHELTEVPWLVLGSESDGERGQALEAGGS